MTRSWAILPLLLASAGPQEPPVKLEWKVNLDSRFTLQFSCQEQRQSHTVHKGVGNDGRTEKSVSSESIKRDVQADLTYRETPGRPGSLALALKKVSWTYGTDQFEVTLSYVAGKTPQTRVTVRERDKYLVSSVKANAEQRAEHMKRLVTGEYDLMVDASGRAVIRRAGAVDSGFSLFARAFLHSPLPAEPVAAGHTWNDTISQDLPGTRESGATEIPVKVASLNEKEATVKGTLNAPLSRPAQGQTLKGAFVLKREFVFSREGYLESSEEEYSLRLSSLVRTTGLKSASREENTTATGRQSMTLKPGK